MSELWQTCIETGLHSLYIPEAAGGSGLGMTELMLVLEAQGKGLGLVPLWRHQVAAAALAEFAPEHFANLLEGAASAEQVLTLSAGDQSRSTGLALTAEQNAKGWLLNGIAHAVPGTAEASAAVVLVETEQGVSPVCVSFDTAGVKLVSGVMTQGESVADLEFDQVQLPAEAVLPPNATEWLEVRAIAAQAALQLGVSQEQIRRTVEYVNERTQFERRIGQFQAVQMGMADCHVAVEALRSALWQLCYRIDADLPAPSEALATAWLACEAGHIVGPRRNTFMAALALTSLIRFTVFSTGAALWAWAWAAAVQRLSVSAIGWQLTILWDGNMTSMKTRRFEDVSLGEQLPALEIPVTVALITGGAIATRDYFPGHHDKDAAQELGSPHVFMNILTTSGLVERFVEGWCGPEGRFKDLKIRLGAPNYPGDTMIFKGEVTALDADSRTAEVTLKGKNSMGNHVTGTVAVTLP